jgi:hypothetical protein
MICRCPSCSDTPDIKWTPEWMLTCEASTVLGWPLHRRQAYLQIVEQKRGQKSTELLKENIRRLYEQRKPRPPLVDNRA